LNKISGSNKLRVRRSKAGTMTEREKHSSFLFTAELQFRFASAARLATTMEAQPLDLPMEWTHGHHRVTYEEIALRQDQADYAACFLHRSATLLMAVAIKDAICAVVPDPRNAAESHVQAAYQVARLIRNAFAHSPFEPVWMIDRNCLDRVFAVPDVVSLDTTGLDGTAFDWRHYGGPLALFRLCRFVRAEILMDQPAPRRLVPIPKSHVYQQGDLILTKIDKFPAGAVPFDIEPLPDGSIPLGNGHVLRPAVGK
jgi:hypothetical protein